MTAAPLPPQGEKQLAFGASTLYEVRLTIAPQGTKNFQPSCKQ